MDIRKVFRLITFTRNKPSRYREYYDMETKPWYEYLVESNVLKRNQNILEIGCGGGYFTKNMKHI